jgi:hypothetical protein
LPNCSEFSCSTCVSSVIGASKDLRTKADDLRSFLLVANLKALPLLPALARRLGRHVPTKLLPVPQAGRLLPDVRRSDHSPFWDQGYAAVMATDTSFLRNPHYHQATDTIASLDLPFLTAVTTGLAEALSAL